MSTVRDRQHAVNGRTRDVTPDPASRTPAGDAFSGVVIRVFRLSGMLADEGDALARPAGQTTARWQVLAAIEDEPRSVAEIARALGLARQSVQRVADALEAGGFVRYEDNPRHRRARLAVLTDTGRDALRRIQAEQRPWADAIGGRRRRPRPRAPECAARQGRRGRGGDVERTDQGRRSRMSCSPKRPSPMENRDTMTSRSGIAAWYTGQPAATRRDVDRSPAELGLGIGPDPACLGAGALVVGLAPVGEERVVEQPRAELRDDA